jgi:ubiquinone/menaquinone biosynthesis C-methylase UbiE
MEEIPFSDEFFDYAICISALHCVQGGDVRKKVVEELYRVLKKGARAYIGVWNAKSKRFIRKTRKGEKELMIGWTDKGERYYYLFDEEEVHSLFKSVGFKIISTHNSEMMINFIVEK